MKLKRVVKGIDFKKISGFKGVLNEIEVNGITANSKEVFPGSIFIAKKGKKFDGSQFIPEAILNGAVAIVSDIYDPFLDKKFVQLVHDDVDSIEGDLAANFYNYPAEKLFCVGVTGTNGKTTTNYLIKNLLTEINLPCGLIGTIETITGKESRKSSHTTLDVVTNQKLLNEMFSNGCKALTMEVSSHGLDQNRVKNIGFDVVVFTNFTQDHLDYHKTMEEYFLAKLKLFSAEYISEKKSDKSFAIINADDFYSDRIIASTQRKNVITYGIESYACENCTNKSGVNEKFLKCEGIEAKSKKRAKLFAEDVKFSTNGTEFFVCYEAQKEHFFSPLIGEFNVYNMLAAIGVGLSKNIPLKRISEIFSKKFQVSGRLERVDLDKCYLKEQIVDNVVLDGFVGICENIFVDYAHTPDALQKVLTALKKISQKRIITVFGCGGDRDKSKRPKMAEVVKKLSDVSIVTTDNPRSEDPSNIVKEIIAGINILDVSNDESNNFDKNGCNSVDKKRNFIIKLDRKEAIKLAIQMAEKEDIVLIAGKGHETYQIIGNISYQFDDREVIKEVFKELTNCREITR